MTKRIVVSGAAKVKKAKGCKDNGLGSEPLDRHGFTTTSRVVPTDPKKPKTWMRKKKQIWLTECEILSWLTSNMTSFLLVFLLLLRWLQTKHIPCTWRYWFCWTKKLPHPKNTPTPPIWKILVTLDHFPRDRGENIKVFETTTSMKMCPANLTFPFCTNPWSPISNKNQHHHLAFNKSSNFPLSHERKKKLLLSNSYTGCWIEILMFQYDPHITG